MDTTSIPPFYSQADADTQLDHMISRLEQAQRELPHHLEITNETHLTRYYQLPSGCLSNLRRVKSQRGTVSAMELKWIAGVLDSHNQRKDSYDQLLLNPFYGNPPTDPLAIMAIRWFNAQLDQPSADTMEAFITQHPRLSSDFVIRTSRGLPCLDSKCKNMINYVREQSGEKVTSPPVIIPSPPRSTKTITIERQLVQQLSQLPSVGQEFNALRHACNLSRSEMASLCSIPTNTLIFWEKENKSPQSVTKTKVRKAFERIIADHLSQPGWQDHFTTVVLGYLDGTITGIYHKSGKTTRQTPAAETTTALPISQQQNMPVTQSSLNPPTQAASPAPSPSATNNQGNQETESLLPPPPVSPSPQLQPNGSLPDASALDQTLTIAILAGVSSALRQLPGSGNPLKLIDNISLTLIEKPRDQAADFLQQAITNLFSSGHLPPDASPALIAIIVDQALQLAQAN